MAKFSIKEAISYGWKTFKKRPWFFVVFSLIIISISLLPNILNNILKNNLPRLWGFNLIVSLAEIVLGWIVSLGSIYFTLRIYDKKPALYSNIFEKWRLAFRYFLASLLYGLIVFGGFILLIIPGIIWSIKFRYYLYFIVDRGAGVMDSLKLSSKITDGNKWQIFLFGLVTGLVNLLGLLLLGVGVLVTMPLTMLASAYVYRKLSAGK